MATQAQSITYRCPLRFVCPAPTASQGPDTDPKAVERIRKAIESGCDTSVCLLNYRADGSTFWNQFFIAALRDADGKIINYVGVQCKVSEEFVQAVQKQDEVSAAF